MAEVERKMVEFSVSLALPWLLAVPDQSYDCRFHTNHFHVSTRQIVEKREGESGFGIMVNTGAITNPSSAQIPGRMSAYSEINITFGLEVAEVPVPHEEIKRVIDLAFHLLNYFLDVYRFITKDAGVRPLSRPEYHEVRAGRGLLVKSLFREGGKGILSSGVAFGEDTPATLGESRLLPAEQQEEMKERLAAGQMPLLSPLLLLNAEMHLRSGQTRFAVLEMSSALDIRAELVAEMILLHDGNAKEVVTARLEPMNTRRILQEIVWPTLEPGQAPPPEWPEWRDKHRLLRHRVVHDAFEPGREEASECMACTRALCDRLATLRILDDEK